MQAGLPVTFRPALVDDLDDLLAGLNADENLLSERMGLDAFDEVTGNLEIHIGIQQSHAHLAQGLAHVILGYLTEAAQVLERLLEFAAQ